MRILFYHMVILPKFGVLCFALNQFAFWLTKPLQAAGPAAGPAVTSDTQPGTNATQPGRNERSAQAVPHTPFGAWQSIVVVATLEKIVQILGGPQRLLNYDRINNIIDRVESGTYRGVWNTTVGAKSCSGFTPPVNLCYD